MNAKSKNDDNRQWIRFSYSKDDPLLDLLEKASADLESLDLSIHQTCKAFVKQRSILFEVGVGLADQEKLKLLRAAACMCNRDNEHLGALKALLYDHGLWEAPY